VSRQAWVIGIGNPLRGDDGVAWQLLREIERETAGPGNGEAPLLRMVHQLTPELAEPLAAAARVLFVDAWLAPSGAAPTCRAVHPCAGRAVESHHLEPAQLLALSQLLYGTAPAAAELLVPAVAFPHGETLSPELRRCLPEARRLLQEWLAVPLACGRSPCMS
jgi:hydrogenase maturation protease